MVVALGGLWRSLWLEGRGGAGAVGSGWSRGGGACRGSGRFGELYPCSEQMTMGGLPLGTGNDEKRWRLYDGGKKAGRLGGG